MTASNDRNGIKFTDEDLARLKYYLNTNRLELSILSQLPFNVEALIARLEAAEVCAKYLGELYLLDSEDENALAAWRKAASKDKGDA